MWSTHLGQPVPATSLPCGDIDPVGITSTPVVDTAAGRVYAVGMVRPAQHMLWDLDLATGQLVGSTPADAPGAEPAVHNQRGALTLANGRVYVPFGGRYGDCGDYHGRVVSRWRSERRAGDGDSYLLPTQRDGGFWAPPGAATPPTARSTSRAGTARAPATTTTATASSGSADLRLLDSFAPTDWLELNASDTDLGSTSPVLLPSGRTFQVGKSGVGTCWTRTTSAASAGSSTRRRSAAGWRTAASRTTASRCTSRAPRRHAGRGERRHLPGRLDHDGEHTGPDDRRRGRGVDRRDGQRRPRALDPSSGRVVSSAHIGSVPSRFTSAAAGGGRVVVAANGRCWRSGRP